MDEDVNLSQIPNPTTSIFRKLWRSYSRDRQSNKDDEPPRYLVKPKSIPLLKLALEKAIVFRYLFLMLLPQEGLLNST